MELILLMATLILIQLIHHVKAEKATECLVESYFTEALENIFSSLELF